MPGGEVVIETFDSKVLRGNSLGDPTKREVAIYLPPKYDRTRRYPAAYAIVGYTGTGKSLLSVDPMVLAPVESARRGPLSDSEHDRDGGALLPESTQPDHGHRLPVRPGDRRMAARGMGAVAAVGSGEHGGPLRAELAAHAARVHRLRDERPVQPDLGRAGDPPEAPRAAHQARVRGVRRHALLHHVPVRRQPSADVPRAPRVMGRPIRDDGPGPASSGRTAPS